MILLLERLGAMDNHHHHHHHHNRHSKAVSNSFRAFESDVLKVLNQLSLNSKILSLSWIHQSLQLLPTINKAFAKLLVNIDYPMSRWEFASVEEYLKNSLNLLELLNSIKYSLSHLGQARVSLSHALKLIEKSPSSAIERLKAIQPFNSTKYCSEEVEEERICSGNEWVIHQALKLMKNIEFWVCGVVVSGLRGDIKPCLEMRKAAGDSVDSLLKHLHLSACEEMETGNGLKDVSEVNNGVACLVAATVGGESGNAAEDLRGKVEAFGKLLEGVEEEADQLFSEVLEGRNELLNSLQPAEKARTTKP